MGFFDSLMRVADPVTARSVKDLNEWTGINNQDIASTQTNSDTMFSRAIGERDPAQPGATPGTGYDSTKAKADARARIDAQMAKWRAKQKPPVDRADDPRHKEVWPLLNKYVPDWKSETRGKGNALAVQARPASNNALVTSGPFDSPETQADILNQYYGGSGVGMFAQ